MTTPVTNPLTPVLAIGTIIQRGDGAAGTEAFTNLAMVRSINGPSFKTTTKDVTAHDSPGRAIQRMATLLDPGDMKFKMNFNPLNTTQDTQNGLLSDWLGLQLSHYKLLLPTNPATTWSMSSMISDFGLSEAVDDVLLADVTLLNFGLPDFTGKTFPGSLAATEASAPAAGTTKTNGTAPPAAA